MTSLEEDVVRLTREETPDAANAPLKPALRARLKSGLRQASIAATALTLVATTLQAATYLWTIVFPAAASPSPVPTQAHVVELHRTLEQRRSAGRACEAGPSVEPAGVTLRAGDCLRLALTALRDGWLYVVNEAPDRQAEEAVFNFLWPSPTASTGAARVVAKRVQRVPDEGWLRVDGEYGYERVWIVWAAQPVPALETGRRAARLEHGGEVRGLSARRALRLYLDAAPLIEAIDGRLRARREPLVHLVTLDHR